MEKLDNFLLFKIFKGLDVFSLLRCLRVCSRWRQFLQTQEGIFPSLGFSDQYPPGLIFQYMKLIKAKWNAPFRNWTHEMMYYAFLSTNYIVNQDGYLYIIYPGDKCLRIVDGRFLFGLRMDCIRLPRGAGAEIPPVKDFAKQMMESFHHRRHQAYRWMINPYILNKNFLDEIEQAKY